MKKTAWPQGFMDTGSFYQPKPAYMTFATTPKPPKQPIPVQPESAGRAPSAPELIGLLVLTASVLVGITSGLI